MKATTLLEKQHRKTIAALKKLESPRHGYDAALLDEVSNDLAAHMAIEQEIFYPAVREVDEDLVAESFEEHAIAELALKRVRAAGQDSETFRPRVTTLRELLEHHIEEEEEDLFPHADKALGEERMNALGAQMKQKFDEVVAQGFEATVPRASAPQTSADIDFSHLSTPNGSAMSPKSQGAKKSHRAPMH